MACRNLHCTYPYGPCMLEARYDEALSKEEATTLNVEAEMCRRNEEEDEL